MFKLIDSHVDACIAELFERLHGDSPEFVELVELGVNHEEQHQELIITDIKHLLWKNPLRPAYVERWPLTSIRGRKSRWIAFEGGLGRSGTRTAVSRSTTNVRAMPSYCVNSKSRPTRSRMVTFLPSSKTTATSALGTWKSLGWDLVQAQGWRAPQYWERHADNWYTFTLHGMAKIDPHTPICHVSFYEADAYARWAGARLPTEAKWEVVASRVPVDGNFLESGALHPLGFAG